MLAALIYRGADVNAQDKDGRTPLHHTAESGNEACVARLLSASADVSIKDKAGRTAGDVALENRHSRITELLKAAEDARPSPAQPSGSHSSDSDENFEAVDIPQQVNSWCSLEEDYAGDYVELGHGRFSKVFLARNNHNGEEMAVKILVPFPEDDQKAQQILLREKIPMKLSHSNVVKVYDAVSHDVVINTENRKLWMLVMQKYNFTLCTYINQVSPVLLTRLRIILQIAKGMNFLHQHKIIHRDVKPNNILLLFQPEKKLNVKIADFSVADDLTGKEGEMLTSAVGTTTWMAVEMFCEPVAYSFPADVFSAGLVSAGVLICCSISNYCNMSECSVCQRLCLFQDFGKQMVTNKNLDPFDSIPEDHSGSFLDDEIITLITEMLSFDSKKRPSFQTVIDRIIKFIDLQKQKVYHLKPIADAVYLQSSSLPSSHDLSDVKVQSSSQTSEMDVSVTEHFHKMLAAKLPDLPTKLSEFTERIYGHIDDRIHDIDHVFCMLVKKKMYLDEIGSGKRSTDNIDPVILQAIANIKKINFEISTRSSKLLLFHIVPFTGKAKNTFKIDIECRMGEPMSHKQAASSDKQIYSKQMEVRLDPTKKSSSDEGMGSSLSHESAANSLSQSSHKSIEQSDPPSGTTADSGIASGSSLYPMSKGTSHPTSSQEERTKTTRMPSSSAYTKLSDQSTVGMVPRSRSIEVSWDANDLCQFYDFLDEATASKQTITIRAGNKKYTMTSLLRMLKITTREIFDEIRSNPVTPNGEKLLDVVFNRNDLDMLLKYKSEKKKDHRVDHIILQATADAFNLAFMVELCNGEFVHIHPHPPLLPKHIVSLKHDNPSTFQLNEVYKVENKFNNLTFNIYHVHRGQRSAQTRFENITAPTFLKSAYNKECDIISNCKYDYFKIFSDIINNHPYNYNVQTSKVCAAECLLPDCFVVQYAHEEGWEVEMERLSTTLADYKGSITERWLIMMSLHPLEMQHPAELYSNTHSVIVEIISPSPQEPEPIKIFLNECRGRADSSIVAKIFVPSGCVKDVHGIVAKHIVSEERPNVVSIIEASNQPLKLMDNSDVTGYVRYSDSYFHTSIEALVESNELEKSSYECMKTMLMTVFREPPFCYRENIAAEIVLDLLDGAEITEDETKLTPILTKWQQFTQENIIIIKKIEDEDTIRKYIELREKIVTSRIVGISNECDILEALKSKCTDMNSNITLWLPCDEHMEAKLPVTVSDILNVLKKKNQTKNEEEAQTEIAFIHRLIFHNQSDNTFVSVMVASNTAPLGDAQPSGSQESSTSQSSSAPQAPCQFPPTTEMPGEEELASTKGKSNEDTETVEHQPSNVLMIGIPDHKESTKQDDERDVLKPVKRQKRYIKQDRKEQNEAYIIDYKSLRDNVIAEFCDVKRWDEISLRIATFLKQKHDTKWRGRIVFNAHGSPDGLIVYRNERDVDTKGLKNVIDEIKGMYDEAKRGSNLFGLDVVFAQCHSDCHTFVTNDVNFRVISVIDSAMRKVTLGITRKKGPSKTKEQNIDLKEFCDSEKLLTAYNMLPEKVMIFKTVSNYGVEDSYARDTKQALLREYGWKVTESFDKVLTCHALESNTIENLLQFLRGCCHHSHSIHTQVCMNAALCTIIVPAFRPTELVETIRNDFGRPLFFPVYVRIVCRDGIYHIPSRTPRSTALEAFPKQPTYIKEWAQLVKAPAMIDGTSRRVWQMPEFGRWEEMSTLPINANHTLMGVCSTFQGVVCCFRKENERVVCSFRKKNQVTSFLLNTVDKKWNKLKNWPKEMTHVVSVLGLLHVFGKDKKCYRYDGVKWIMTPISGEMLETIEDTALHSELLGKLYVIPSPEAAEGEKISLYCMDPLKPQSAWCKKASLPESITDVSEASLYGYGYELFLLGGMDKCCAVYDADKDTWKPIEDKPKFRHYSTSFKHKDTVVMIGSSRVISPHKSQWTEADSETFDLGTRTWTRCTGLQLPPDLGANVFVTAFNND